MGSDTYFFNESDGQDTIIESQLSVANSDVDQVVFGEGIVMEDIWFSKNNNDLTIEQLKLKDGSGIVNALVDTMASFAIPEQGEVTLFFLR